MAAIKLILAIPLAIIAIAWAFGAVWFDAPFGAGNRLAAVLLAITFVVVLLFVRPFWRKLGLLALLFGVVLGWWLTLKPSNNGNWQPDVAQLAWAEINGDEFTFHNVRNCDYRTDTDYTPHWETRTGGYRRSPASISRLTIGVHRGLRIPSSVSNSPTPRHSASPSRRERPSARLIPPSAVFTGSMHSSTSSLTSAM
jgi:hypothetical protein